MCLAGMEVRHIVGTYTVPFFSDRDFGKIAYSMYMW